MLTVLEFAAATQGFDLQKFERDRVVAAREGNMYLVVVSGEKRS